MSAKGRAKLLLEGQIDIKIVIYNFTPERPQQHFFFALK